MKRTRMVVIACVTSRARGCCEIDSGTDAGSAGTEVLFARVLCSNDRTALFITMGKYSFEPDSAVESAKARGSALRAHFKQCREITNCLLKMKLSKAKVFLEDVLQFKQAVKFTKFTGGIGRHAQGKLCNAPGDKVRWPQKATQVVLDLLKNAEANAEMKGLDVDELYIKHAQSNRAQKQRRRTYRAHGRINPYMSHPAHIEIILCKQEASVKKGEEDADKKVPKLTRKRQAQLRLKAGGAPGTEA